jgi:hypothetical protein
MSVLRSRLIRLAHANPELRPHLLPLLKEASYKPVNFLYAARELAGQGMNATTGELLQALHAVHTELSELYVWLNHRDDIRGQLRGHWAKNQQLANGLAVLMEALGAVDSIPMAFGDRSRAPTVGLQGSR